MLQICFTTGIEQREKVNGGGGGEGVQCTDRLVVADGVDLCTKHYSCESEEEDGFETEEDEEQHRHPWRELTAL